jgi:hypothetical protein
VAKEARAARDALIASGRFPRAFTVFVNGVRDAREETISPTGAIVYDGQVLGPAIAFALGFLAQRSPKLSGDYGRSFMIAVSRGGADGRPIPMAAFRPEAVSAEATGAFIYSPLPYSRKVDVQLVGSRKLRFSAPPGLYDDAARAVRSRYPTLNASRLYTVRHPTAERREDGKRIEYPSLEIQVARA